MDCNAGAQLGRQLHKDATMMHGGLHVDPSLTEYDALMQFPGPAVAPPDLALAFQQQQHVAAVRQQHEMEQVFHHQQAPQVGPQEHAAVCPSTHMLMQQQQQTAMMSGMLATNAMGAAMMIPRTSYQPTLNFQLTAPQTNLAPTTAAADSAWADQLGQQQWAQDYSAVQNYVTDGQKASTVEEKTKESEFYKFMDSIRNGQLVIDEDKGEVVAGRGLSPDVVADTEYLRNWAQTAGLQMPESVFHPISDPMEAEAPVDFERNLDLEEGMEDWAKEYMESQQRLEKSVNNTDYPFEPNNPYRHHSNAYEEGVQMLQLSNLAEAALAFEAACQQHPDHFDAWKHLGSTQASNEKDNLAIIALNNARRINPRDLSVHAALSVSHSNEHNTSAALDSLKAWLLSHPEYEVLGSIDIGQDPALDADSTEGFFFADPAKTREVHTLYQAAVEMHPRDADVYANLGVMHNITHNFDAAIDAFRHALDIRPADETLWNKLGATLANGGRAEEALQAYYRAIDINPGFVRAMYNMAVAYSNMGKYPQAARQVVRAIAVQQGDTNPTGEGSFHATRGMWELLRMTLNLMDRQDLVEVSYGQQLEPFLREFGLEGMV